MGVFSLTGWARPIQSEFLVIRSTQVSRQHQYVFCIRGYHPILPLFPKCSTHYTQCLIPDPITPTKPKHRRFGLFPVRSPLLRESLLFSLPLANEMFQFTRFASLAGYVIINHVGCPIRTLPSQKLKRLVGNFRSLLRPSSPPRAKASTVCPSLLLVCSTL